MSRCGSTDGCSEISEGESRREKANPASTGRERGNIAIVSDCLLTVLGHIIISNARYLLARLNYLLHLKADPVDFIVEPSRNLTALHRCAMTYFEVHKRTGGVIPRAELDVDTNADIMYELLMKWRQQDELDAVCGLDGSTALHLAVEARNLAATRSLLEAGASTTIRNDQDETAVQLAKKLRNKGADAKSVEALLLNFERRRQLTPALYHPPARRGPLDPRDL